MECPNCHSKLYEVIVTSKCWQRTWLDENGKMDTYGNANVEDTIEITCLCGYDVTDLVNEAEGATQ